MTDLEKLEARIEATEAAILATRTAANTDRKLSHDKHMNGHFTKALTELSDIHTGLKSQQVRLRAIGR